MRIYSAIVLTKSIGRASLRNTKFAPVTSDHFAVWRWDARDLAEEKDAMSVRTLPNRYIQRSLGAESGRRRTSMDLAIMVSPGVAG